MRTVHPLVAATLCLVASGAAAEEPPPVGGGPPAAAGAVSATGAGGFGFTSTDGSDSLFVHWLVQADSSAFLGDLPPGAAVRDGFALGFSGLQLDATLASTFRSSFLVDFSQSRLTLLDAFIEGRFDPALVVRLGKFPTPLTEERLAPKIMLPWFSTSPASFLLPVRELGLQISGALFGGLVNYNLALVNGSTPGPITDGDTDSSKDVMGRLYLHPLLRAGIEPLEKLAVGLGASYGDRSGSVAAPETPLLRTYGNATFFSYRSDGTAPGTAVASGTVARLTPHATWAFGPVAAFADWVHTIEHVGGAEVVSTAWSATATVSLTGEETLAFSRIRVRRPWAPSKGWFGGLQLVAGGGHLRVGTAAFDQHLAAPTAMQQATFVGAGLNWYPVSGVGLLVDFSFTRFDAYAQGPQRPDESTVYARCEFRM